jgi:hypothetical protein
MTNAGYEEVRCVRADIEVRIPRTRGNSVVSTKGDTFSAHSIEPEYRAARSELTEHTERFTPNLVFLQTHDLAGLIYFVGIATALFYIKANWKKRLRLPPSISSLVRMERVRTKREAIMVAEGPLAICCKHRIVGKVGVRRAIVWR